MTSAPTIPKPRDPEPAALRRQPGALSAERTAGIAEPRGTRRRSVPTLAAALRRVRARRDPVRADSSSERSAEPAPAANGRERRAHPRRSSSCECRVVVRSPSVCDAGLEWVLRATRLRGPLLDVSLRGLAVRLSEPIAEGRRVAIAVRSRAHERELVLSGTVLRSQPRSESEWDVVVRLTRALTLEDVSVIGRSLAATELT